MTSREYREMRQRITIKKQSGSYVVAYPIVVGNLRGYSREEVFSPAIGGNAYAKARTFAVTKAKELAEGAERCVVTEVTCRRCRIRFRAAAPANSHNSDTTICAEPGCSVPFWHRGAWRGPAKVGVHPADVVAHRDSWLSDIEAGDAT